jgi:Zn-dependent peptidase ImmA (M78 family)/DNA-binding XRE family transcriptional regulator
MNDNPVVFSPSRLSLARRRRGLTKRGLAEAVRIAESTVAAYESTRRLPPQAILRRIARVLNFPVAFFGGGELERLGDGAASFRALSKMKAADRERALAGAELGLELNNWLAGRFTFPPLDIPDLRPQSDPEAAAMALRVRWGLSDKPITNMVHLLEAKGVRVFSLAEECEDVDAFSFWQGSQAYVFLNTMKSAERSRFDAAHELGHLALHQHGDALGRQAEIEANGFASAFLMPRSSVLAYAPKFPTMRNVIEAKKYWGVSAAALIYRLHAVGKISEWHYRMLAIELQQLGYRKAEPGGAPREYSQALEKVFAALRAERIRKNDVADALNWPLGELRALIFGLVVKAEAGGGRGKEQALRPKPSAAHLKLAT